MKKSKWVSLYSIVRFLNFLKDILLIKCSKHFTDFLRIFLFFKHILKFNAYKSALYWLGYYIFNILYYILCSLSLPTMYFSYNKIFLVKEIVFISLYVLFCNKINLILVSHGRVSYAHVFSLHWLSSYAPYRRGKHGIVGVARIM